jgi:hypothetical protein
VKLLNVYDEFTTYMETIADKDKVVLTFNYATPHEEIGGSGKR